MPNEERQLRMQIEQLKHELRFRQQMRWQTYIALATILAATAACAGLILVVAHFMR